MKATTILTVLQGIVGEQDFPYRGSVKNGILVELDAHELVVRRTVQEVREEREKYFDLLAEPFQWDAKNIALANRLIGRIQQRETSLGPLLEEYKESYHAAVAQRDQHIDDPQWRAAYQKLWNHIRPYREIVFLQERLQEVRQGKYIRDKLEDLEQQRQAIRDSLGPLRVGLDDIEYLSRIGDSYLVLSEEGADVYQLLSIQSERLGNESLKDVLEGEAHLQSHINNVSERARAIDEIIRGFWGSSKRYVVAHNLASLSGDPEQNYDEALSLARRISEEDNYDIFSVTPQLLEMQRSGNLNLEQFIDMYNILREAHPEETRGTDGYILTTLLMNVPGSNLNRKLDLFTQWKEVLGLFEGDHSADAYLALQLVQRGSPRVKNRALKFFARRKDLIELCRDEQDAGLATLILESSQRPYEEERQRFDEAITALHKLTYFSISVQEYFGEVKEYDRRHPDRNHQSIAAALIATLPCTVQENLDRIYRIAGIESYSGPSAENDFAFYKAVFTLSGAMRSFARESENNPLQKLYKKAFTHASLAVDFDTVQVSSGAFLDKPLFRIAKEIKHDMHDVWLL